MDSLLDKNGIVQLILYLLPVLTYAYGGYRISLAIREHDTDDINYMIWLIISLRVVLFTDTWSQ